MDFIMPFTKGTFTITDDFSMVATGSKGVFNCRVKRVTAELDETEIGLKKEKFFAKLLCEGCGLQRTQDGSKPINSKDERIIEQLKQTTLQSLTSYSERKAN